MNPGLSMSRADPSDPSRETRLETLAEKRARAIEILSGCSSVVVALSGGVDSAVLLALAMEALGADGVLAVTGRSAAVPARDLDDARRVAETLGARHRVVETRELDRPGYRANAGDRCLHCRVELFGVLHRVREESSLSSVVYGAIGDDLGDFRPGMKAAEDLGVRAPLLEAGLGKEEIRELARRAGLPVRDKPAAACLASRLPVGTEVTPERLSRVERAEEALRGLGFRQFRVRHHGEVARVELEPGALADLLADDLRRDVVAAVKAAGYRYVALDLEGYRSGSLNPEARELYRIAPAREGGQ
jgi:uncharacterized protein